MAYIILPSRRTRQPQGAARLDESSWLLDGVYDVWAASNNWIGCRRGRQFSIPSTATTEITPEGWAFTKLDGSSSLNMTGVTGLNYSTSPRSLFVLCRTANTKDAYDVAFTGDSASYQGSRIQLSSTGTQWMGSDGGFNNVGGAVAVSTTYQIGYAIEGSTLDDYLYVNGALVSTDTSGRADNTIDRLYIGGYKGQDGAWWNGSVGMVIWWNKLVPAAVFAELQRNPWQLFAPDSRRLYFGASGGGATTDATIAGTQAEDVGAITAEATTGAAIAGAQASDIGAITTETPANADIAGVQASDIGAITAEATTGSAIAGTQASDGAAVEVTASTGQTDAAVSGIQTPDVGAIDVTATLGLEIAGAQATDLGYIVVEATLPATMAGTQASDGAAITIAGSSIWTDINPASSIWTDIDPNTIWTGL